jgi:hypothetical protein
MDLLQNGIPLQSVELVLLLAATAIVLPLRIVPTYVSLLLTPDVELHS